MSEPDPLSDVLRSVRLSGAIFLDAELSAPWGFTAPAASVGAPYVAASAEHLILFHLLVEGEATARIPGQAKVTLEPGDIAVLPQGEAHEIWNGRVIRLTDGSTLLPKLLEGAVASERGGGGGRVTKFICGYIACERQAQHLFLAGLPPLFKVNIRRGASGAWIESTIRQLASPREPTYAGQSALLAKLAEALFIETLRCYMAELPRRQTGWLAAVRDPAIGRALAAIHREPARAWTVASLAEQAAVSRTVFSERFTRLLGETPLTYVSHCRMQLGARLLETTDDTVLRVALNAGYESEAAFNRAFKREFNVPPARYRSQRRAGVRASAR
jgi:AraC-like DNA-binding protein